MTKLESYESSPRLDLNKDQIEALEKKAEVSALIKELEEIVKQFQTAEAEEVSASRLREDAELMDRNLKIATAIGQAQASAKSTMLEVLDLLYTLNVCLPTTRVSLSEPVHAALHQLRSTILPDPSHAPTHDTHRHATEVVLQGFLEGSETSTFGNSNVSYAELRRACGMVLFPPPPPRFGMAVTEGVRDVEEQQQYHQLQHQKQRQQEMGQSEVMMQQKRSPILATKLSFVTKSEILDM